MVEITRCNALSCECKYCKCFIPQRWLGPSLSMLAIIMAFAMRICTHLVIVRMVKNTTSSTSKSECSPPEKSLRKSKVKHGDNDWDQSIQGWILATFYIGYLPFQFPAGALADKFGARWILSTGFLMSTICCFFFGIAADNVGHIAVILLRLLQGIGQAVLYPSLSAHLGRWTTRAERARISSVAFTGSPIGTLLSILISGLIMDTTNNWRFVYYFWGLCSFLVYGLLILYYYSDPVYHPHITQREAIFLKENTVPRLRMKPPYVKILLDSAVIATIAGQSSHMFPLFFFSTNAPKYIDQVLRFPVAENSLLNSLPYIGTLTMSFAGAGLADYLVTKKQWDVGFLRKTYSIFCNILPGLLFLALGYSGCNYQLAVPIVVISLLFMGLYFPGVKTNTIDLTSQYAGFTMALPNGISSIIGVIIPLICGYMAPDNTLDQWIVVFWILCIASTSTALLYMVMASGKRRRWDYAKEEQKYFEGKVSWFSCKDGIDKDKLAVEAGRAAETDAGAIENV